MPVLGEKFDAVLLGSVIDADGFGKAGDSDVELSFIVGLLCEEGLEFFERGIGLAARNGDLQFPVESGIAVDLVFGQGFLKPAPARLVEEAADGQSLSFIEAAIAFQHQFHA